MPLDLHWDAGVAIELVLALCAYFAAARARERHTGQAAVTPRQALFFVLSLFTLWLAQGTPLDGLSDDYLFSAHMLQHMLICFAAAPLLLLGLPEWLLRSVWQSRVAGPALRWLTRPVIALVIFNLLFSIYHFPGVFESGLHNDSLHFAEHVVLFATALLMWWPVVNPLPEAVLLSEPMQLLYLFLMMVAETVAFGIVTFSPVAFYPTYIEAPRLFGLSPLDDQQLGGAIMQIVVMAAIVPFAVAAFQAWYRRESQTGITLDTPLGPAALEAPQYGAAYRRPRASARRPVRRPHAKFRVLRGPWGQEGGFRG